MAKRPIVTGHIGNIPVKANTGDVSKNISADGENNANIAKYESNGQVPVDEDQQTAGNLEVSTGVAAGKWVSTLPVDKGYAWVILVAYMVVGYFGLGLIRVNGIFYVQFMKYYSSPPGSTSWITTAMFGLAISGAGGFLVPKFGVRPVVFTGGLLMSLSFVASSFVAKAEHLFGTITIMYGLGFALVFTPSIGHVPVYFDKRRGIANGIGTAASSLGTLVAAPLVTYLVDIYGLKGTLLLTGGMTAHLLIAAMLLRPAEFYKPKWESNKAGDALHIVENIHEIKSAFSTTTNGEHGLENKGYDSESLSKNGLENTKEVVNQSGGHINSRKENLIDQLVTVPKCCGHAYSRSLRFLSYPGFYVHVIMMLLVYWALNNINVILIPVYAKEKGFSDYQGAFLMSIHAGLDLIGRLFFGWLMDHKVVPRPLLFAINMMILAVITAVYPLVAGNYVGAAVTIGCVGFFMAIIHTGNFMLLADKVGVSLLQKALAVKFLMICLPSMLLMQLPAELFEEIGSWKPSFYLTAAAFFISSVIIFTEYFIKRAHSEHKVNET